MAFRESRFFMVDTVTGALLTSGGGGGGGNVVITDPLNPLDQAGVVLGTLKASLFSAGAQDFTGYGYSNTAPNGGGFHLGVAGFGYSHQDSDGRWYANQIKPSTPDVTTMGLVVRPLEPFTSMQRVFVGVGSEVSATIGGGYGKHYSAQFSADGTVTTLVGTVDVSNDGTNWTTLISFTQADLDVHKNSGATPVAASQFRLSVTTLVLGTATQVTFNALAVH